MINQLNATLLKIIVKIIFFISLVIVSERLIAYCLKTGLVRKYGLNSGAKVLCVGHSHTVMGLDAEIISNKSGISVAKYATSGADTTVRLTMLRHYLSLNSESTKVVVYDVASNMFNSTALGTNAYKLFYPFMDDLVMKDFLWNSSQSWEEYYSRYFIAMLRYNSPSAAGLPSILNEAVYGFVGKQNFFHDRISASQVELFVAKKKKESSVNNGVIIIPEAQKAFEDTINFITSKGIRLVLVYIPTINLPPEINQEYVQFDHMIKYYKTQNKLVEYLNYKDLFGDKHELFCDPGHLNRAGQKIVSEKLAEDLVRLGTNKIANHDLTYKKRDETLLRTFVLSSIN